MNHQNPHQIANAVQQGTEQYEAYGRDASISSSVTDADFFGYGPRYTWPDVIPNGLHISQPMIKTQPLTQPMIKTKPNEINLCTSSAFGSSNADPFDYAEESPSKTPPKPRGSEPEGPNGPMRLLGVSYTFYLLKGTDLLKSTSSSRSKKPVYSSIALRPAKILFDIESYKWQSTKNQIFLISSEIDETDDELMGNAAILKAADASNKVVIMGYIHKHDTYGKGIKQVLNSDKSLELFYKAVKGAPGTEAGFTIVMENPAKAAQEAADSLTKKQGRLRAHNHIENVPMTSSSLARLIPLDPHKEQLTALQVHLGSFKNHNNEGWRIFNQDNLSLKMELNFRHLIIWAKELAAGTPGVTLNQPPTLLDFVWKEIKRPLHNASSSPDQKRTKADDGGLPFKIGSYAEMQGANINIDFDTLQRIIPDSSLLDYLHFCELTEEGIDEIESILIANRITRFHRFLFPDVLNAKIIESWGISWGVAMELMTHPRKFYLLQVKAQEQRQSKGKGRAIVPDSDDF